MKATEGDAAGVAKGNVFARVRKTLKLPTPPLSPLAAFRLSQCAEADLLEMGAYTLRQWGADQAVRYLEVLEDWRRAAGCSPITLLWAAGPATFAQACGAWNAAGTSSVTGFYRRETRGRPGFLLPSSAPASRKAGNAVKHAIPVLLPRNRKGVILRNVRKHLEF
jgi:hypothetical protein